MAADPQQIVPLSGEEEPQKSAAALLKEEKRLAKLAKFQAKQAKHSVPKEQESEVRFFYSLCIFCTVCLYASI